MTVIKVKHITRAMLQNARSSLFVFGDNLAGSGYGGQARDMRDEPNAIGIPTKAFPGMGETAFFRDVDFERAKPRIDAAFARLRAHVAAGGTVVWPADGIGTGLAQLPQRAPLIWRYIETHREQLERHDV
jgi:hypothetical protein